MTTVAAERPSTPHRTSFFTRLLNLCVRLLPYMSLPGYYPGSHAYHFRTPEQGISPVSRPQKKIAHLPAAPFHR